MPHKPDQHRDRYDVSGNTEAEFVDDARTVLVNLKGIRDLATLQVAEEEALGEAYETLLLQLREDTCVTCDLIQSVHKAIFGGLYTWAGRWRTVWISKPGMTWPAPDFLDQAMQNYEQTTLRRYPAATLTSDAKFHQAAAEFKVSSW